MSASTCSSSATRAGRLLAALESGAVEAVTRADCRDEYRIVLHYPHLPLDDDSPAAPPPASTP
jgi:hypothetical protein